MITDLQNYWWLLISVLGALLVFMLFVQGGQSMILCTRNEKMRQMIVNTIGRKWELSFTMLTVFGGAFFASFPLFYSTSFGGAYWLWMLILITYVLQAVSYEFRRKSGNVYGTMFYDVLLVINGVGGCVLLGVAVGTMIFGAEFSVTKGNLLNASQPIISTWDNPLHGLEAIASWRNLLLGFVVLFLARTQAGIYILNRVAYSRDFYHFMKRRVIVNSCIFVVLFLTIVVVLLTSPTYHALSSGAIEVRAYGFIDNISECPLIPGVMLLGVVLVLAGIMRAATGKRFRFATWSVGIGTVLVVMSLFWLIGYNDTAYYPSLTSPQSSLTIRNSSSSEFTLKVMSWVSVIVPFVLFYIAYVWRRMDKHHLKIEDATGDHSY
jgi:cytochrome d ubiquinol oxidase subunit II